jgi:putative acetyltransferase
MEIVQAVSNEQIETVRGLFREYEKWLGLDLCFQGFEQELATLPGKYAPPQGRLFLVYSDNIAVGCAALRPLEDGVCEMKRLFVREGSAGRGFGRSLIKTLINDAKLIGYKRILLDTFPPKMAKAVHLYESHGFRPIEPYYYNPNPETLFMELALL